MKGAIQRAIHASHSQAVLRALAFAIVEHEALVLDHEEDLVGVDPLLERVETALLGEGVARIDPFLKEGLGEAGCREGKEEQEEGREAHGATIENALYIVYEKK